MDLEALTQGGQRLRVVAGSVFGGHACLAEP